MIRDLLNNNEIFKGMIGVNDILRVKTNHWWCWGKNVGGLPSAILRI